MVHIEDYQVDTSNMLATFCPHIDPNAAGVYSGDCSATGDNSPTDGWFNYHPNDPSRVLVWDPQSEIAAITQLAYLGPFPPPNSNDFKNMLVVIGWWNDSLTQQYHDGLLDSFTASQNLNYVYISPGLNVLTITPTKIVKSSIPFNPSTLPSLLTRYISSSR